MRVGIVRFPEDFDGDLHSARTFQVGLRSGCSQCETKDIDEASWWATTMREYNNRDKRVNDMELDPCMAAEVRLKKKRMGSKNRKILVLLLAALLLLCLAAVFLILLLSRSQATTDSGRSDDYEERQTVELLPASAVLKPSPETEYFRRASDDVIVAEASKKEEGPPEEPEEEEEDEEEAEPSTVAPKEAEVDEDEEEFDEEEDEEAETTTKKPSGIDWSKVLPEMDDDYERNLAEAADAQKDLAFVETEVVRSNCFEYFKDDYLESGVYKMESPSGEVFFAACDMDTGGKGWTVMSRRINDFMFWNRTFEEYAVGFGNPGESHWLGLDRVHELVSHFPGGKALLRIELRNDLCSRRGACSGEGAEGYWWGEWKFAVDDRSKLFKLSVSSVLNGNLSTTAFDYFHSMNNNQPFTTVDRDNDRRASRNCAVFRNYGGWWHRDCGFMALNGKYGVTEGHSKGLYWLYQHKTKNALGTTVTYNVNPGAVAMLLRPL